MNKEQKLFLNSFYGAQVSEFATPAYRAASNYCVGSSYARTLTLSCKLIIIERELFAEVFESNIDTLKPEWLMVNEILNRWSIKSGAPVPIELLKDLYLNYPKIEYINNIIEIIEKHIGFVY